MTSILTNYKPTYEEKMTINSFFMCRYLSNNPMSIFIGNAYNRYYTQIPLNVQYDMAKQLLSGKIKFIQFPKKPKNEDKLIENICRYYKVNLTHAREYLEFMTQKERDDILKMYETIGG